MKPLILINFKTYPEAIGKKALLLAQEIAKVRKKNYLIAVAPSLLTVKEIAEKTNLIVFAQHCDPVILGAHTGSISPAELKAIGVQGTILNHSERKIPFAILKETVRLCNKYKLKTIICASTIHEAKKIARLHPEYLAYEPKELIGGTISVTEAKPDTIVKAVEAVKKISPKSRVLCGAGVHTKEDIKHALLLGTEGVLIGHAVPKAKDPRKFLEELLM